MSIIHDALKKTQSHLSQTDHSKTNDTKKSPLSQKAEMKKPTEGIQPSAPQKKNKKRKHKWLIIILIISIMAGASALFFINFRGEAIRPLFTKLTSSKIFQSLASQTDQSKFTDNLVLNGTMMMGNKRVALINNEIYELGEHVKKMKIINITLEKVDLLNNNDVVTLRVRKHINQ